MAALQAGEALGLSGQCSFCLCSCTITGWSRFCRATWLSQSGLVCPAGPVTAGFSPPTHEPFLGPRQLGFLCPSHTRGMGVSGRPQSPSTVWLGRPLHTQILGLPSAVLPTPSSPDSGGRQQPLTPNFSSVSSESSVEIVFPTSQSSLCKQASPGGTGSLQRPLGCSWGRDD